MLQKILRKLLAHDYARVHGQHRKCGCARINDFQFLFGLLHTTHIDPRFDSKMPVVWSDEAVTIWLDALQPRECMLKVSNPEYKNKNKRKTALEELVELLQKGRIRRSKLTLPTLKRIYKGYGQLFVKSTKKCARAFTRANPSG